MKILIKNTMSRNVSLFFLVIAVTIGIVHTIVMYQVDSVLDISIKFGDELKDERESSGYALNHLKQNKQIADEISNVLGESTIPFEEIYPFDDDAKSWTNLFSAYASAGLLVFDANDDGKLDVYCLQPGNNWSRPTDKDGVLLAEPRYQSNTLYINLGNDHNGRPTFQQAGELAKNNEEYVYEELLVENYLFPRKNALETKKRPGREGQTAVAADLNNDGRLDLLVGNALPGMIWSHEKTQRVLPRFVRPEGRKEIHTKQPLTAQGLFFVNYTPRHNLDDSVIGSRGEEAMGANTVLLNEGDKDGDGLPEWRDVSKELHLEGKRNTYSILVADFDLDGDLDIFEGNSMDPDFWPGGSTDWAGGANQFYVNQLAETGNLDFIEKSEEMDIDGVYDKTYPMPNYYRLYQIPFDIFPVEYSLALMRFVNYKPKYLEINGKEAEHGQISWASVVQDVNDDGYPDIWVANDLGLLRLYINQEGGRFINSKHARSEQFGFWMSLSPADYNGDLKEDLFAGNLGGSTMNSAFAGPRDPYLLIEPVLTVGVLSQQFFTGKANALHTIINGSDYHNELKPKVRHSKILPPDTSRPNNVHSLMPKGTIKHFDIDSLDPYEFSWGSTVIDIQNDGRLDLYYHGCLYGRGGGTFPLIGTGPGRLLVNATDTDQQLGFIDLTAEHHLFNIKELDYSKMYSDGYIVRKAPNKNWGKRDVVYSHDLSVWAMQGPKIQKRLSNYDMIQTTENGRAAVAADLNNDGFEDLILRNMGGYDSRASNATNLKSVIDGKAYVIPGHNENFPTPTNFDPGDTRVFINQYDKNNWIKVALEDRSDGIHNRNAIGAQVVINNRFLKTWRAGSGGFISNYYGPVNFGLGESTAKLATIYWPNKERAVSKIELDGLTKGILKIVRNNDEVFTEWEAIDTENQRAEKLRLVNKQDIH